MTEVHRLDNTTAEYRKLAYAAAISVESFMECLDSYVESKCIPRSFVENMSVTDFCAHSGWLNEEDETKRLKVGDLVDILCRFTVLLDPSEPPFKIYD